MNYGKYKSLTFEEVSILDPQYCQWILKKQQDCALRHLPGLLRPPRSWPLAPWRRVGRSRGLFNGRPESPLQQPANECTRRLMSVTSPMLLDGAPSLNSAPDGWAWRWGSIVEPTI
mmetsp:Transcript_179256/g.568846  ORF Transcript_179256/g.568846 Transcript_179256/m.568846 type:complete len:116 (-) Transcript_179256:49-396(-)